MESLCLRDCKVNAVFYTKKKDKDITALASYYGRSISTERLIVIGGSKDKPSVTTLTKVTLLS